MATFNNYATLSYRGGSTVSNLVTGEIVEALSLTKTAVTDSYTSGGQVTYALAIVNSGAGDVDGLTVTDNLGTYTVGTGTVWPLTYTPDSVKLFVNGALQAPPAAQAGPPLVFQGITVPGGGSALLLYEATANEYAPLDCGDEICNTATLSGGNLAEPITASETVQPLCTANLSISKFISPTVVAEDGSLTYTFVITNYGTVAADATDEVSVSDTFDPTLNGVTVTLDGTALTADEYSYTAATGAFSTKAGVITVPAATVSQDAESGVWTTAPGTATLVISGTI